MNEFWMWFWRPIAEFLGAIAFLAALVVVIAAGMVLYACYVALRQKLCRPHDMHSVNGQWQAARWRCRKCGLETNPPFAAGQPTSKEG